MNNALNYFFDKKSTRNEKAKSERVSLEKETGCEMNFSAWIKFFIFLFRYEKICRFELKP